MFANIDVVRYTQVSRLLKVAEEYGRRLLQPSVGKDEGDRIARHLAEGYPEHGFIIDRHEAEEIGLKCKDPTDDQRRIISEIAHWSESVTAIGRLHEVKS